MMSSIATWSVAFINDDPILCIQDMSMEFPELGVHCAEPSCSRLDFLPFTCDACHKVFCLDHKTYEQHKCTESYSKDARVPVCPLCSQPVPINRGEDPNIKVDQHIHNDCRSEAAKKLYTNRCSYKGCKKKEIVQVNCNTCRKTFCLKHRFETDHACEGPPKRLGHSATAPGTRRNPPQLTTLSAIGAELNRARLDRSHKVPSHQSPSQSGGVDRMSEDQALATAIAASLHETPPVSTPPQQPPLVSAPPQQPPPVSDQDEDEALARAIAASLQESSKPTHKTSQKKDDSDWCTIS